jgi:hypothetical protein
MLHSLSAVICAHPGAGGQPSVAHTIKANLLSEHTTHPFASTCCTGDSLSAVFCVQILEQEVSYLMRIASGINPNTQRTQASTVKLLASTLLNLDGDESEVRPLASECVNQSRCRQAVSVARHTLTPRFVTICNTHFLPPYPCFCCRCCCCRCCCCITG